MRNLYFYFLFLFFFTSCTSDDCLMEEVYVDGNEITEIRAIIPDLDVDDVKSRTSFTTGPYGTVPNPVWIVGDSIGIYPDEGDQLSFRITTGGKTCPFSGGGWAMKASSSYTAYSPFQRSYYFKEKSALPVNMLGQTQKGNDNSAHLSAYDILIAKGDKPSSGSLNFQFTRQVALVRMELTAPKATTWTSVSLESDASFTTEAVMNLSLATPTLVSKNTSNSVTLALANVETTSDNLGIIAYMMLLPVDLTNKKLMVKLTDNEGNVYVSVASITNNKTNFSANGARWVTANDFKLYEKPDYSWYSSQALSYGINTAGQFLAFAKLVNGDADALEAVGSSATSIDFSGKTVMLNEDISLSAYCGSGLGSWTPISEFKGTFNGNGNTISDLYCNHAGDMGLFGVLSNATIKNLTVQGEITRTFDGSEASSVIIGGLASSVSSTVFENCISNVNITTSGSKSTAPISCSIGGVCGSASYSTFIACQSSSAISDTQGEREYNYYLGGLVGRVSSTCYFVACTKMAGDVEEETYAAYTYVGGVVGYIPSDSQTAVRACYTSVYVSGRQPGHILGSMGMYAGKPNISASYYAGSGYGMNGVTIYGIGTQYYGGSEKSYDYGTARSTDLATEIQAMNDAITTWNTENPEMKCNYRYVNGANGLELVAN